MINSFDQMNIYKKATLEEVAKRCYNGGIKKEDVIDISLNQIPYESQRVRCCIYKEREIIRERAFLAMGLDPKGQKPNPNQFMYVIPAACDDCEIHKVRITDNCRKCLFKSCLASCKFDAIVEKESKMEIDYSKCKACTMCAKACPYSSILVSDRPCHKSCPTGALIYEEGHIAKIDESKCINCGQCQAHCPFGAISEISFIKPVIENILKGKKVIALVAPSILGQWGKVSINQIYQALKAIGFSEIIEVAQGADITTKNEAIEALEAKKENRKITTSCCTAFVSYLKQMYPEVYKNHTSDVLSPMAITGKIAREKFGKDAIICFLGPCVAKKAERLQPQNIKNIDYVLTFEEVSAMMRAKNVDPKIYEDIDQKIQSGSKSGRGFCFTGGVASSLNEYFKENNINETLTIKIASGPKLVAEYTKELAKNMQSEDVLEGMMCEGGCISGIDTQIKNPMIYKNYINEQNSKINTKIEDASNEYNIKATYKK